ncbi:50S ribosomal protein L4/L1e [Planoprotostelium fungivorum]|uniref:Large ribosomal subunit protein uL4m n=1 Tax=Planoprotostelium fungivorum TaxID=1890364 RepID=A0A2P6NTN9_9EUKA|nr:50S ribosomal protein L4/L1e [Planoprotostelium fungivorum]
MPSAGRRRRAIDGVDGCEGDPLKTLKRFCWNHISENHLNAIRMMNAGRQTVYASLLRGNNRLQQTSVRSPIQLQQWRPVRSIHRDSPGAPAIERVPTQVVSLQNGKTFNLKHPYLHLREKPQIQRGNQWDRTEEELTAIQDRIAAFPSRLIINPFEEPLEHNVFGLIDKISREPVQLDRLVFDQPLRVDILHRSTRRYLAGQRQGTHSAKRRDEVSGGGRKPRPQKGGGTSRQGSIRSPQWRHGGVVFPPKPRDYSFDLPKGVERLAMKIALSAKLKTGHLVIVENFDAIEHKTKTLVELQKQWGWRKPLYVTAGEVPANLEKASRSLDCEKTSQENLIVYKMLTHDFVVIERRAIMDLQERLLQQ